MPRLEDQSQKPLVYRKTASFKWNGERDAVSMRCKDILYCASHRLPLSVHVKEDPSQIGTICLDILEKPEFGATAWSSGTDHWIIVHRGLITKLNWFIEDLFSNSAFASVMNLSRFSQEELLHVKEMTFRMAVEASIEHELGHISWGHTNSACKVWKEEWGTKEDQSKWRQAMEMIADDMAAEALAHRARHHTYYTTFVSDVVRNLGELPMIIMTLIGVFAYFSLVAHGGHTSEEEYPPLDVRIRYFYMVFQECLDKDQPESSTSFTTFFPATMAVVKAFAAYFHDTNWSDADKLAKGFEWVTDDEEEARLIEKIKHLNTLRERFMPIWSPYRVLPTLTTSSDLDLLLGDSHVHLDVMSEAIRSNRDNEWFHQTLRERMPDNPFLDLLKSVNEACKVNYDLYVKESITGFAEPILMRNLENDDRPEFQKLVRQVLVNSAICISQAVEDKEERAEWLLKAGYHQLTLGTMGIDSVQNLTSAVKVFFLARETTSSIGGPLWIASGNNEAVARVRLAQCGQEPELNLQKGLQVLQWIKGSGQLSDEGDRTRLANSEQLLRTAAGECGVML